jgi:hypothetical protein
LNAKIENRDIAEKISCFFQKYDSSLYHLILKVMSEEERNSIVGYDCPSLACGNYEALICSDGIILCFINSLAQNRKISIEKRDDRLGIVFSSIKDRFTTFTDPVTKLQVKGYTVELGADFCPDRVFLKMVFPNHPPNSGLFPSCSKVFVTDFDTFFVQSPSQVAFEDFQHAIIVRNANSKNSLKETLASYDRILNSGPSEEEIHQFLFKHPILLAPDAMNVMSKPSLVGERSPDFAIAVPEHGGKAWLFVEIEQPDKAIFTTRKDFQFSAKFQQAESQIHSWMDLFHKDHRLFESRFPGLYAPRFLLVYGRSAELVDGKRERLVQKNVNQNSIEVLTFDDLKFRLERIMEKLPN